MLRFHSFPRCPRGPDASLDDTLAAPPCTQSITRDRTTQTVKEVLRLTEGRRASRTVIAYDSKSAYGVLARGLGSVLGRCQDPQIASWLLDPGAREQTLHSMVTNFLPEALPLLEGTVWFAPSLFCCRELFTGKVSNLVFFTPSQPVLLYQGESVTVRLTDFAVLIRDF